MCGLAVQLPAQVSDGLSDSVFLLRYSSPPKWATDLHLRPFKLENKQNEKRILYGLFFVVSFLNTISGIFFAAQRFFWPICIKAGQTFQWFLQRSSYLCFLCDAKNSLFCFRPFPEVTLLARRRWRGAVMSFKKRRRKNSENINENWWFLDNICKQ